MAVPRYLFRRAVSSLVVLVLSAVIVFLAIRILPGDPVLLRFGARGAATPAALAEIRKEAGLDRPILVQLLAWMNGAAHGNFGTSFISQRPVNELVAKRIPATIELAFFIVLIACLISVLLVSLAIRKPGGRLDRIIGYGTSIGFSTPSFIIGIILVFTFSLKFHILPSQGFVPFLKDPILNLKLLILPSVTGALVVAPYLIKYLRTSILEIKSSSYVRTAKGKGLGNSQILRRHIFPNSIVPTLTMLGLVVGYTLGGVFVIEYMFAIPGIGSLAIESASARDYSVLQGVSVIVIFLFIVTTFTFDLICGIVDPRVRNIQTR